MSFRERHAALQAILGPAFVSVTGGERVNREDTIRFSVPMVRGIDG
jgi:hypothetical protein